MKNITKILAVVMFFGAFSVSVANADFSCHVATFCTSSEVSVLEMAKSTNSHAGLPGSGYPYSLCCSGAAGLGNSCSGGNSNVVIAKLSGSSNAHIRAATEADYPGANNACISTQGSFEVAYQQNDCSGAGVAIASMAKFPTNSHIGGASDYQYKICVKYTAPPSTFGFMGGGGGGGSTSTSSEVALSTNQNTEPNNQNDSLLSRVRSFFGGNSGTELAQAPEASVVDLNEGGNFQDTNTQIVAPKNNGNVLAAAAGASDSSFLKSPFAKVFSWILLLVLVIIGRKVYLNSRRKNSA